MDNIVNEGNLTNFSKISLDYKNGKNPSELAEYHGFDIIDKSRTHTTTSG